MNKKWIVCIVLLLFILGGFVAYNKKKPETIETLNALINSESVSVQSPTVGKIKLVAVEQDQKVKKGQVLAEIVTEVPVQQNVKTIDKPSTSVLPVQNSSSEYENAAMMYKDGVITKEEYDKRLQVLNTPKSTIAKTQNKTILTSKVTKIYAPIDGMVILNNFKTGDKVSKDTILAKVNSLHKDVTATFPATFKEKIVQDSVVTITVIKYPEKIFTGRIVEVLEPDVKGIPVKINFDDDVKGLDFQNGDSVIVKIK